MVCWEPGTHHKVGENPEYYSNSNAARTKTKMVTRLLVWSAVACFGLCILNLRESLPLGLCDLQNDQPILPHSGRNTLNDMMKPWKKSLHPKWKLWTEMDDVQKQESLDIVGRYIKKYGNLITGGGNIERVKRNFKPFTSKNGNCTLDPDIGANGHQLCGPRPPQPCSFISFGINDDPTYDLDLANHWGCRGFAGDPTVHHPSKLHEKVTFHNIGATLLMENEEREIDKGGTEQWWLTSMPKLRYFLELEHIDVLKLDCEGCEVAFSRDIIREDPTFLEHVDQINIETHVTRTWINSTEQLYYFGLHFALLEEAGFVLEWSQVFGCSKRHEIAGCIPEITHYGFPCGYRLDPLRPNIVNGHSCQDFLWRRP